MAAHMPESKGALPRYMELSSLVAASICVLPFLLPHHALPLPSFQAEWLAFALGTTAAGLALIANARRMSCLAPLPRLSQALFALAAFVAIQNLLRPGTYASIPVLAIAYIAFAATMVWLGSQLSRTLGQEKILGLFAGWLFAGALITALLAFVQYIGRPAWLEEFVAGQSSERAYGNIAQSNLFANYIALGEASLIFLWVKRSVSTPAAAMAAVMLAGAGALSGARSTLLFVACFAALGIASGLRGANPASKRMMAAGFGMALVMLACTFFAHWIASLIPTAGSLGRTLDGVGLQGEPRWQAWRLALDIFRQHPLIGAGWGSFPGAAFSSGISPEMTLYGEVWTSAHNLPLHLLSEVGLIGTAIIGFGLFAWAWTAGRTWLIDPNPAFGWVFAIAGVELAHSLVEFPLWSGHFLGLTALAMGAGNQSPSHKEPSSRLRGTALAVTCIALSVGLMSALRDYVLLESTHITGTTLTLAAPAQVEVDTQTMKSLARGLFAAVAEAQIFSRRSPETPTDDTMLQMGGRLMRFWPSHAVALRHAIDLAQSDRSADAITLVVALDRAFPLRCAETRSVLARARALNPKTLDEMMAAIGASTCGRSPAH